MIITVHNIKKKSENLEKCLCKGQGRMLVIFGHCIKNGNDPACEYTTLSNSQLQVKAVSCKEETSVNMIKKRSHLLWSKFHLKWTVIR